MALLTDLVIASRSDAEAICRDARHGDRWPTLQLNGLDNAKLAALAQAWGEPDEARALEGDTCVLAQAGAGGPWVILLSEGMRNRLAALRPDGMPPLAQSWAAQDELRFDGWRAEGVAELLRRLQLFAARAVAAEQSLMLWVGL